MSAGDPVVLVVEDEPPLLEIYVRWLEGDYEVRTATSGEEALDVLDDSVNVVLLDRLMPGMSGDETIEAIRDRDYACQVAMVTAVEPDFDIITMGVDAYLTKPVDRETLLETVDQLLGRKEYADLEREFYRLVSKRAALRASKDESALETTPEYVDLQERIEDLRSRIEAERENIDDAAFVALVRDIEETETDHV